MSVSEDTLITLKSNALLVQTFLTDSLLMGYALYALVDLFSMVIQAVGVQLEKNYRAQGVSAIANQIS